MNKILRFGFTTSVLTVILTASSLMTWATGVAPRYIAPAGLSIAQIKMTGDEFIVVQNNTSSPISDLGSYWLYAFNKTNPADAGSSSSGQQLPIGQLDAGQTLLLSSKARATCGAQIAGDLSLSLGDSAGYLELVKQSITNGVMQQTPIDSLSWSSATAGIITKVPSNTTQPAGAYYRTADTASGWQLATLDSVNSCQLNALIASAGGTTTAPLSTLLQTNDQPPATIIDTSTDTDGSVDAGLPVTLPAADTGLAAPQITELLPNPDGSGNDDSDEFIELYNPNTSPFDLSGFILQTGLTTKHSFTFALGTALPAQSFVAFHSSDTGLSLSNTSGAADLLDPPGNVISQSDAYSTAKDGIAWALANGKWYWTTQSTPNAANVIKQPVTKTTATKTTKTTKTSTSSVSKTPSKTSATGSTLSDTANASRLQVTPIHSWTLAAVALLAVAYGIYEYRLDLANRFYKLRRHYANRRHRRRPA